MKYASIEGCAFAVQLALGTAGLTTLSGCGDLLGDGIVPLAAAPLCAETPGQVLDPNGSCKADTSAAGPTADLRERLAKVVLESTYRCNDFVRRLNRFATGSSLSLDAAGTLLGALSVAFAPANTKQALSAAHTIVTGWQSNIDSDILAKSSIGTYAHAIKVGYMGDIQTYIKDQLDTFDATKKSYSAAHASPHFVIANAAPNSPAVDTAWLNFCMSGKRRCSGMLGIRS